MKKINSIIFLYCVSYIKIKIITKIYFCKKLYINQYIFNQKIYTYNN